MTRRSSIIGGMFLLILALVPIAAPGANPSIGVNFVGGSRSGDGGGVAVMAPNETAGVQPQSHWNNAGIANQATPTKNNSGTLAAGTVRDSTGAVVPSVQVVWKCPGTFSTKIADTPGNPRLMKGYLDTIDGRTTVTVSGLPYAESGYDLIVYFDGLPTSGTSDRVGRYRVFEGPHTEAPLLGEAYGYDPYDVDFGGRFIHATGTNVTDAIAGNYIRFAGLHASTFTIEAQGAGGDVRRAPINAIQIVAQGSPTITKESSSVRIFIGTTNRTLKPEQKAEIALAAVRENETIDEMANRFGVNVGQILQCRRQLLEGAVKIFSDDPEQAKKQEALIGDLRGQIEQLRRQADRLAEVQARAEKQEALIADLYEQVGRLHMEVIRLQNSGSSD